MNPLLPDSTYIVANALGTTEPFIEVFDKRDPTPNDNNYPIQKRWFNYLTNTEWILVNFTNVGGLLKANWVQIAGGAMGEGIQVIDTDGGGVLTPAGAPLAVSITGLTVANGLNAKPLFHKEVTATSGQMQIQVGAAVAAPNILSTGLSNFDDTKFTVDANGFVSSNGSGIINTLSDDVNTVVTPVAGKIQLVGHVNEGAGKFSTVVAGTNLLNINPMSSARWIVDQQGFNGTHTTISAAIAAATAGDTIQIVSGTYVEDIILKAGVDLCALPGSEFGNVTIMGKVTASYSGTVCLSHLNITTNNDYCLVITNTTGNTSLRVNRCLLNGTNHDAIFSNPTSTNGVLFNYCAGTASSTFKMFSVTNSSNFRFISCFFTSNDATANTISGTSAFGGNYSIIRGIYIISGSCGINFRWSVFQGNGTTFTVSGTSGLSLVSCTVGSNTTNPAIALATTSGGVSLNSCVLNSTGPFGITGTGLVQYDLISITSGLDPALTILPFLVGPILNLGDATNSVKFICGTGSPDTVVTAPHGSFYSRVDGSSTSTRLYVNTNGATSWTNIVTAT